MRWNKRTALLGLMVLLPLVIFVAYLARPRPVHKQTVTASAQQEQGITTVWQQPPPADLGKKEGIDLLAAPKSEPKPLPPALALSEKDAAPVTGSSVSPPPPLPLQDANITNASANVAASPALPAPPVPPDSIPHKHPPRTVNTEIKCPWNLRMEVVKGRTILTAETGKGASFRIDCERLELKSPQGAIQAMGDVKISSNDLEGKSDRLTVSLQDDQVILEGRATLLSRRDGEDMEVKGERLSLRLVRPGAETPDKNTVKK